MLNAEYEIRTDPNLEDVVDQITLVDQALGRSQAMRDAVRQEFNALSDTERSGPRGQGLIQQHEQLTKKIIAYGRDRVRIIMNSRQDQIVSQQAQLDPNSNEFLELANERAQMVGVLADIESTTAETNEEVEAAQALSAEADQRQEQIDEIEQNLKAAEQSRAAQQVALGQGDPNAAQQHANDALAAQQQTDTNYSYTCYTP